MSRLLSADGGWRLWRRRWVRWLAWAVGALLVFWGVAWLAVPPLVKWQGQKIATEKLGRPVRIGAVQFQPWSLALTLRDLTVGGAKPADPPQFAAKRLYANLSLASALRLAPVVQAIQVDDPALRLRHLGGGHYDVDDILARLNSGPKPPPNAKPARFALYNIAVRGGRITFIDDPVQRTHQVRDLKLTLPFISNLPAKEKVRVTPQLAFTVDGSRFDSGAQALPFEASRRANAHVRIQRFDLAPYLVYQPASLPVHVTAGTLDADLHLAFEDAHKPSLTISGTADLTGVKVNDAVGQQALAFDRLAVSASDVRPLERVVHLASVDLAGPRVLASRDAQGRINWVPVPSAAPRAAASAAKVADKPARKSAADDWHVTVDHVAIAQGDVQWRDARPAPGAAAKSGPATVHIAPFMLEAKNLTWPPSQAATFNGRLALAGMAAADTPTGHGQGAPAARGKFALDKAVPSTAAASAPFVAFDGQAQMLAAKVDVQARGLPLRLAQPYLAAFFKPALTGQADADVDVAWSAPEPGGSGLGADKAHGKNAGQNAGGGAPGLTIEVSKLALNHLALLGNAGQTHAAAPRRDRSHQPELPPGALASVDALTLEGAKVDLPGRSVAVDAIAVQAPRVRIARDKQGRWMFEDWLVKPAASAKPATRHEAPQQDAQAKPWAVRVGHVAVADGGIGWRDQQPASGAVDVALTQLKLDARDFALGGRKPMPLALSAQLTPRRGETGKLSWRGAVGITPVSARGQVDAERLPLQAFEPYVAGMLNIDILRADASFKGKVDYAQQDNGPRLHVAGDARLEQLHTTSHPGSAASDDTAPRAASNPSGGAGTVVSAADASAASAQTARVALAPDTGAANTAAPSGGLGEELLSWKQLRVAGLDVKLDPGQAPRVAIRDSRLSDFYARVVVHPNGRINLQDLVKIAAPVQPALAPASAFVSVSASASSPVPAASADVASNAPVMHFGPTHLVNGRVSFSDHFIKPNYSADLTQIDGSLGAFSSVTNAQAPQMADLQLAGRAEGTAQLAISGKLNPLAHPLALGIAAKVTDLELPPLSPYSVKYSGHGIERGKLSMDVAYKITPDGQLTAANKLVLNQLQFGEQVPGAPASLPVTLATTLLADSNGVINLDLPISGSLNDPQFSLGPIIFKAIINLIGKAITAPFTLLAHAFGGGSGGGDMSQVPFAPGSAALSDAAKAQLDKVAKALADRPKLKLTVAGAARLNEERDGLKRERLMALVAAEKRASGGAPETPGTAAMPAVAAPSAASDAGQAASAAAAAASGAASAAAAASAADYAKLLRRVYRRADIPGKPRNLVGMTKNVPVAQMESLLLAHINVGEGDIEQLAAQRAVAVKDYLLTQHLNADRVFIGAAKTDDAHEAANGASTPASAAEPASATASASAHWTPHAALALSAR